MTELIRLAILSCLVVGATFGDNTTSPAITTTAPSTLSAKQQKIDPCTYTWVKTSGGRYPGGVWICAVTVDGCQQRCIDDITCTGIDDDSSDGCYLLYTGSVGTRVGSGYDHYEITRDCPAPCLPACTIPILVQQSDGTGGFNRNWADFKNGFTDTSGNNFWIGNDKLHNLTKDALYKVRFELQAYSNSLWYVADYDYFIVDAETNNYMLHVWGYRVGSNVSDYMTGYNNGMKFTTTDRDNDLWTTTGGNCATYYLGGWWHYGNNAVGACTYVGINTKINSYNGFSWWTIPGTGYTLKASRMWLLCR